MVLDSLYLNANCIIYSVPSTLMNSHEPQPPSVHLIDSHAPNDFDRHLACGRLYINVQVNHKLSYMRHYKHQLQLRKTQVDRGRMYNEIMKVVVTTYKL